MTTAIAILSFCVGFFVGTYIWSRKMKTLMDDILDRERGIINERMATAIQDSKERFMRNANEAFSRRADHT